VVLGRMACGGQARGTRWTCRYGQDHAGVGDRRNANDRRTLAGWGTRPHKKHCDMEWRGHGRGRTDSAVDGQWCGRGKVHIVGDVRKGAEVLAFDPARDVPLLARELAGIPDLGLLIIDPLVSSVSGDAHKSNDVRRSLQPIADLAAASGAAVLGLSHFSKGTAGRDPVERVTGSIAFGAAARLVLGAAKRTEEQGGKRIFVRAKSNLGPDDGGFVYDLEQIELPNRPDVFGSRVVWGEALEGTAKALLSAAETDEDEDTRSALEDAKDFLGQLLDCSSVPANLIWKESRAAGHSEATIRRAARELSVVKRKVGLKDGWAWELPAKVLKPAESAHQKEVSAFGEFGQVQEDAHPKS